MAAEPTYTNADIDTLKVRYEPRHKGVNSRMPGDFWERPYKAPDYVQWLLPYQKWEAEYQNYFYRHYHYRSSTFQAQPDLHALYGHGPC